MKKLKLNSFKTLYKTYKTNVPVLDFLLLGLLVWIEEAYVDYKIDKEVTDAVNKYQKDIHGIDKDWKETAKFTETWDNNTQLPTLSISNELIKKSNKSAKMD